MPDTTEITKTTTVDELVEQWREQLGLLPWAAFADAAAIGNRLRGDEDLTRQSGRTTRGILEALARCQVERLPQLYIGGAIGRTGAYWAATDLADRLELDTRLRFLTAGRAPTDGIVYTDHTAWQSEQERWQK